MPPHPAIVTVLDYGTQVLVALTGVLLWRAIGGVLGLVAGVVVAVAVGRIIRTLLARTRFRLTESDSESD